MILTFQVQQQIQDWSLCRNTQTFQNLNFCAIVIKRHLREMLDIVWEIGNLASKANWFKFFTFMSLLEPSKFLPLCWLMLNDKLNIIVLYFWQYIVSIKLKAIRENKILYSTILISVNYAWLILNYFYNPIFSSC